VAELQARNLLGEWKSNYSSLNIYCSGAVTFQLRQPGSLLFGADNATSSCSGCVAQAVDEKYLILGPLIKTKIKINKWPYEEDGLTKMDAEGTTFERVTEVRCE
jgi:hypothetical protein